MMRRIGVVAAMLLWSGSSWADPVRIGGTGAALGLAAMLAKALPADVEIVDSLGTSGGYRAMAAGKLDVGLGMRPPKPREATAVQAALLCRTPMVFFAHKSRKDVVLHGSDLTALYDSALPDFPLGAVRPLLRPQGESGFIYLGEEFPQTAPIIDAARLKRGAVIALTDQDAMDEVQNSTALIGFGALAPIIAEQRPLIAVPLDGMNGADLSTTYPLWVNLYLALPEPTAPAAKAYYNFALSPQGKAVLRKGGCLADGPP